MNSNEASNPQPILIEQQEAELRARAINNVVLSVIQAFADIYDDPELQGLCDEN